MMMNKKRLMARQVRAWHSIAWALVVGVSAIALVQGMELRDQAERIVSLERQSEALSTQLASYKRTLCSTTDQRKALTGTLSHAMVVDGVERTYRVHVPTHYDPSIRYPVVFSFDGIEGSGERMEAYSSLDTLPALVVYPDSLPGKNGFTAWQGAPYSTDGERDIAFVRLLINELPSQYCIDETRLFAVGMSNGGSFATIVGCEMGAKIRAVASVSGAFYATCEQRERTPSLLILHSEADRQVPFLGSPVRGLPKVEQWVRHQAIARDCQKEFPGVLQGLVSQYDWKGCRDGSLLRFVVLKNQPHGWLLLPQVPKEGVDSTAGHIWMFFEDSMYE